jgi:hypothetical protein
MSVAGWARASVVCALVGLSGCGGGSDEADSATASEVRSEASGELTFGAETATVPAEPQGSVVTAAAPAISVAPSVVVTSAPVSSLEPVATAPAAEAAAAPPAPVTAAAEPVAVAATPAAPSTAAAPAVPAVPTFASQLQARPAKLTWPGSTLPILSRSDAQQVARLSRDWAVPALWQQGHAADSNGVVVPPLQFAWMQGVASAARGQSQAQLLSVWPAASASPTVTAALMRGVERTVMGRPEATVVDSFISSVALDSAPGTLASLTLQALIPGVIGSDPLLQLELVDRFSDTLTWAQALAFNGHFYSNSQGHLIAPMLRVQGMVVALDGPAYEAQGLFLGAGRWLFKVTPPRGLSDFGTQGLATSLAELATALGADAGDRAVMGDMVVPADAGFAGVGLSALDGLTHALDRINADMRGLDGRGGTYLRDGQGFGGLRFNSQGLRFDASRSAQFVFEPLNVFNSGAAMVIRSNVDPFVQLPACPSKTPDLRPSYFVLMDGHGRIELLAGMGRLEGQRCQ